MKAISKKDLERELRMKNHGNLVKEDDEKEYNE